MFIVYKNNIQKKKKKGNDNKTPEVPVACLITVPKDSYIDRICCPEPVTFVYSSGLKQNSFSNRIWHKVGRAGGGGGGVMQASNLVGLLSS